MRFIIPIRKEEEWKVINDTNPIGFCTFGGGFTTSEKYEVYYNIYGWRIFKNPTVETQKMGKSKYFGKEFKEIHVK